MTAAFELAPFPANYEVQWETWYSDELDELYNAKDKWHAPEARMVIGWSSRRIVMQDGIHQAQDEDNLRLAVPADFPWAARDIVTIPSQNALGGRYRVKGSADANMGFHGWRPGLVLEVQRVEG